MNGVVDKVTASTGRFHTVCLMSKPLRPCFVAIVLLIMGCTHCWAITLGDTELAIAIKRPAEPSTSEVLEGAHGPGCFQRSQQISLEQFFPYELFDDDHVLLFHYIIGFSCKAPFNLEATTCTELPHENVQSAKQLDPVVKTLLDALNSNTCWILEERRCLVVEDLLYLCPIWPYLTRGHPKFNLILSWMGAIKATKSRKIDKDLKLVAGQ